MDLEQSERVLLFRALPRRQATETFSWSKLQLDPASAPLITSIADISGVLIYFSIATAYLGL
jgi:hypothetical protein